MRSSGVLLPLFSLPDGRIGPQAYRFVDFLAAAGQRWWQLLPLHPPGPHGAPYSALSSFAGNEAFCEPDGAGPGREFLKRQRAWLPDYARFRALHDRFGCPWVDWPKRLPELDPAPHLRAQFAFEGQWLALKRYANERGVGLIGDLPFFVAHHSADVWTHRDLFKLNKRGNPTVVTGVPPDYFSRDGQRWDHPHYDWAAHKRQRYAWWKARMRRAFQLFDMVRIDHFLGVARAWEVSARAKTARGGRWGEGPGRGLLKAIAIGPLIAEDLGVHNPEADALREEFGLPGMRVLQFCFGPDPASRPYGFPRNCAVYTGTHDNDTASGWYRTAGADGARARRYAGCTAREIAWGLVRVAWLSAADLAIVPVQDLLGLGSQARINRPGVVLGNWSWRLRRGQLTAPLAKRLRRLTADAGR